MGANNRDDAKQSIVCSCHNHSSDNNNDMYYQNHSQSDK